MIPFGSDIKFNLFIRSRNSEFELREEIEKANIEYANLGERVLAFARYKLSSEKYKKGY